MTSLSDVGLVDLLAGGAVLLLVCGADLLAGGAVLLLAGGAVLEWGGVWS